MSPSARPVGRDGVAPFEKDGILNLVLVLSAVLILKGVGVLNVVRVRRPRVQSVLGQLNEDFTLH